MANTEKLYAWRTDPGSGDKIGTYIYFDPITGDTIHGEQTAQFGYPVKFIKVANQTSTTSVDLPAKGAITISSGTTTSITFSGAFAASADASGNLVWIENDASGTANDNTVRKLINSTGTDAYDVNLAWAEAPASADTYRLLLDCFRYNAAVVKVEFSATAASAPSIKIRPFFFTVPQDNDLPTPGVATPIRYAGREYTILNTSISVDPVETSYYHGEVLSFGVQGAMGMCLQLTSAPATGSVSIWVGMV